MLNDTKLPQLENTIRTSYTIDDLKTTCCPIQRASFPEPILRYKFIGDNWTVRLMLRACRKRYRCIKYYTKLKNGAEALGSSTPVCWRGGGESFRVERRWKWMKHQIYTHYSMCRPQWNYFVTMVHCVRNVQLFCIYYWPVFGSRDALQQCISFCFPEKSGVWTNKLGRLLSNPIYIF